MMRRFPFWLILLLAAAVVVVGLLRQRPVVASGPRTDTIVIVGGTTVEGEVKWTEICVVGKWTIARNSAGQLDLDSVIWRPGNLFLFNATHGLPDEFAQDCGFTVSIRLDKELPAFVPKAGVVYAVTPERSLHEAAKFDPQLKRTVKQLARDYGIGRNRRAEPAEPGRTGVTS
jgi:hypothetical protein